METEFINQNYINIAIYTRLNSDRRSLFEALLTESGYKDTSNYITYKEKYYYLSNIACRHGQELESILINDIVIFMIDIKFSEYDIPYYTNLLYQLFINGVNNIIVCIDDMQRYNYIIILVLI
jgi:hypothetical protein